MIRNNKIIFMLFLVVGLFSGFKMSAQTISSTLDSKTGVIEDRWVEFTASVTEGNDSGLTVNERLILDDSTQASEISAEYKDGSGNWHALSFSAGGVIWFGPSSGFPLQDATTTFRVKFNSDDTYAYNLEIIKTSNDSVIATSNEEVVVHPYVASTIASTLDAKTGGIATKVVNYTVTNTAGTDSNTMVKGYITLSDTAQAKHIKTEYTDGTNWYPLAFNNGIIAFGPPSTGFPLKTATSYFRTTFDTAGTFAYKLNIISMAGDTLATTNESVKVNPYVAPSISSTLDGKTGVIEDRWVEFTSSVTEGSDSGRIVNERLILDDATQASNITAEYKDGSGNWQSLSFSTGGIIWFGPSTGFPLQDATTTFRVKFNNADTIAYSLQVIDASTSAVISSTSEDVIVNAYVAPTITSTLDGKTGVVSNRSVDYSVTTTTGSDSNTMVIGYMTLSDKTQASHIKSEYKDGSTWYPLSFNNGIIAFGPSTGFPLKNTSSYFRTTFDTAGTYAYTLDVVVVATGDTLASTDESVTVKYQAPSISSTLDAMKNVIEDRFVEFTSSVTEGSDSGRIVNERLILDSAALASHITAEYKDGSGNWQSLSFSTGGIIWFGPSSGFPLKDATTTFRVKFNNADTIAYSLQVIDASSSSVISTTSEQVIVNPYVAPSIFSTLDAKKGVIEDRFVEFTSTVTEGSDSGRIVNERLILDDATQASDITAEYKDGSGNWQSLSFSTGGIIWFGPSSGFPLKDATTTFRVKFNNADTIAYSLQVIDASTSAVISTTSEEVVVNAYVAPSISSTLDGKTGIIATKEASFSVTTTAGSDSNTTVKAYITLADAAQASDINVSYYDGSNWTPLTFNNGIIAFGPSTGFTLADATTNFKVTFDNGDTYDYTLDIVTTTNDTLASAAESVTVADYIAPTIVSTLDTMSNLIATKEAGFDVTLTAGSEKNTLVDVFITLADTTQASDINVSYTDGTNWYPLTFTNGVIEFGPSTGFALTDATTSFKVTFADGGTYDYTLDIVSTTGDTLASTDESAMVADYFAPKISSTLNNKADVIATKEVSFDVTIKAGTDVNRMVKARLVLDDATQASNITASYYDGSNWQSLTFANGELEFGPSSGFALANATINFKATFASAGTYNYNLEITDASTNDVLVSTDETVTIGSYTAATIASTLNNMSGIIATKEANFSVSTTSGSEENEVVNAYITLADPTQASNISVSYFDGTSYQPLTFSNGVIAFGPSTGFALTNATTDFKVTFADGGTYAYTLNVVNVASGDTLASSAESVTVADFIAPTIASTLNNMTGVIATKEVSFDVTVKAGTDANRMVKARLVLDDATQASNITASYFDGTSYQALTFVNGVAEFGASAGFALADATTNFKITFASAGTYNYNLEITDASTNDVLVSTDETVTIGSYTAATIASTLNNMSGVIATKEANFSVSTTSGSEENEVVNAYITLADPTQASNISVSYFDGTTWFPLTFTNGVIAFGPSTGFALTNATTDFKVTFADGGTYAYTLDVVNVASGDTLASSAESVTVADFIAPTIASTLNNMTGVIATKEVSFDVTVKAGTDANRMVKARLVLDDATQASNITASYFDGTSYQALTFVNGVAEFGTSAGFALADATTNFKITFASAGTYNYNLEITDASTNDVLVSTDETVTVAAFVAPTIASTLNNMSGVIAREQNTFSVTTVAGTEAGRMVKMRLALDDAAQASDIAAEYYDGSNWVALTFVNGVAEFGPSAGAPLADATTNFRVIFNKDGVYNYNVEITDATSNAVIVSTDESVTVGVNGINESSALAAGVNVYPNPAVSNLTIALPQTGVSQVWILTATGQTVKQLVNVSGKVNVEVSSLAKGIYFVKVVNGNQSTTKRIEILK